MTIKIFADGADLAKMRALAADLRIWGFTTNPTLARRAGVTSYREFAEQALEAARGRPVSIEVLSDDFGEMARQARVIAALGENAFVKIPVTNSRGESSAGLIADLSLAGIAINVTAVFTPHQVADVAAALRDGSGAAVVSVFAGRIADAGVDPLAHVTKCRRTLRISCPRAGIEMLWASPRQVYDVVLAERAGCEIITMSPDLIDKLALRGKNLNGYSRETVAMFAADAQIAGFEL